MAQVSGIRRGIDAQRRTPDIEVADLATAQHRVIEYSQLRALRLGRGAIQHRVRSGRLHRVHHRVYAVGHRDIGRSGFLMAAVLACGPDALLSYRTAGAPPGAISRSAPPTP